jgi:hypothetical protein
MKTRCLILALVVGLGLGQAGMLLAVGDKLETTTAKLIAQLGSKKFKERDKAAKALEAMGASALPALRKAAKSDDAETSKQAKNLIDKIERTVEAAALLAPTKVHLVCKDTPVTDAVAKLAKLSKYDIKINDKDKEKLAKRKITLDTGKVTFWEAFDMLCKKGKLVEATFQGGGIGGGPIRIQPAPNPGAKPLPIRIQPAPAPQPANPAPAAPAKPVAIQNVQVQVQVAQAGAPVPAPQPAPGVRPPVIRPGVGFNPDQIVLSDGKPEDQPTCYSGAFRIRLKLNPFKMPAFAPPPGGNNAPPAKEAKQAAQKMLMVLLEVRAEPKVKGWYIGGSPTLESAVDDKGQKLKIFTPQVPRGGPVGGAIPGGLPAPAAQPLPAAGAAGGMRAMPVMPGMGWGNQQVSFMQLQLGEKEAKKLKEFKCKLPVRTTSAPEALITVDNILKAAGKTIKGAKGGSIKVIEADKDDDGNYKIRFELDRPQGVMGGFGYGFGGGGFGIGVPGGGPIRIQRGNGVQIQIQVGGPAGGAVGGKVIGGGAFPNYTGLSLVDAKGKALQLTGMSAKAGQGEKEMTLTFKPVAGQGKPAKFIFTGQRSISVDVPVSFKNVKLP